MNGYLEIEVLLLSEAKAIVRIKEQTQRAFTWESKRHPGCILKSDGWPDIMIHNTSEKRFQFYLRGTHRDRDNREVWMERWVYDILIDMIDEYNGVFSKRFLLDERLFEL